MNLSAGTCPASPALRDGAKGHNTKGNYLTGKLRPLGRGASLPGLILRLCSGQEAKGLKIHPEPRFITPPSKAGLRAAERVNG
jgi:hypothetical protein